MSCLITPKPSAIPAKVLLNWSPSPLLILLACFALSLGPKAFGAVPDGGYPNNNTVEGDFALNAIVTNPANPGFGNTAIGEQALKSNTTGD